MQKNFDAIKHKDVRGNELYYIKLEHGEKNHLINVGKKTYDEVSKLILGQEAPELLKKEEPKEEKDNNNKKK